MQNKEKLKKLLLDEINKKDTAQHFLTPARKKALINWIETGQKPKDTNTTEYRNFYVGYAQLRRFRKVLNLLLELEYIK